MDILLVNSIFLHTNGIWEEHTNSVVAISLKGLFGDFHVRDIEYLKQEIQVYDPHDCLQGRLMNLNFSSSPFIADYYQAMNMCTIIVTLPIPVSWPSQYQNFSSDLNDDLKLTWNVPDFVDCQEKGGICGFENSTGSEIHCFLDPGTADYNFKASPVQSRGLQIFKIIALSMVIPAITCSFVIACLMLHVSDGPSGIEARAAAARDVATVTQTLFGQQLQNCEYINLKCSTDDITILNLPYSGEFYVQDIIYEAQIIQVYDPNNCLPRRLMDLNLSSSHLRATEYQDYTFYSCPRQLLTSEFKVIDCLSNLTWATIATSLAPREVMERVYKCKIIFTSSIAVSWMGQLDNWGTDSNLQLVWNDLACKDCEDGSRSKLLKALALALSMPGIVIISTCCCLASCMQLFNMVRDKIELFGIPPPGVAPSQATMFPGIVPPQATMFPGGARPPTTSAVPIGLDDSKIKSSTELVVLSEGQSISGSESNSCPICLEGYHPKESVMCISVCKHGFHANCIEQWLRKNGSCPVCRESLSDDQQVVVQDVLITSHIS